MKSGRDRSEPAGLVTNTMSEYRAAKAMPASEPVALTRTGRPKFGFGVTKPRHALEVNAEETPVIVLSFGLPERSRDPEQHTVAEWSARANRKSIDEVVRWLP